MNRIRSTKPTQSISLVGMISLILAGAMGAFGGVIYVFYRNEQIQTAREIDSAERGVEQYQLDISTLQMRSDQILNLFAIRKTLEEAGTNLVPIPMGASEDILKPNEAPSVASTSKNL